MLHTKTFVQALNNPPIILFDQTEILAFIPNVMWLTSMVQNYVFSRNLTILDWDYRVCACRHWGTCHDFVRL